LCSSPAPALCDRDRHAGRSGRSSRSPEHRARYNRVAVDLNFGGIADNDAEGERLAQALGNKNRIMLGNHGVLVVADTVESVRRSLHGARLPTLALAYATGQKLNVMPAELAERTAQGWDDYKASSFAHFAEMKQILDEEDPSYAT
jgi:hypothetical protein